MNRQPFLRYSKLVVLFALLFSSCTGGQDVTAQLEVTETRYQPAEPLHCSGTVKNISSGQLSNLKVDVEFQTGNGDRVRVGTVDLAQNEISPNASSNFSAPYLKGHNDPQVARCRVLTFKNNEGEIINHINGLEK